MNERTWLWTAVAVLLVLLLTESSVLVRQRRLARHLTRAVARFMCGDYAPLSEKTGEGAIPALVAQVNLLAQRMQHQLAQLHKEKEAIRDFLYDVSHQLKTPLTTLHLYADMDLAAAAEPQATERARDFLALVTHMESLVQALLQLARLEAGADTLCFAEQDLKQTAEQVIASLQERLAGKCLAVRVHAPETVLLRYDSRWLGEALRNVVANAADHAPEDTAIDLAIGSTGAVVTVSVADCGPGIADADLPHVFERFYRSRSDAENGGCGLGLALASQVIQRHHGSIAAANRPAGGAVFTLTLPRYALNISA